MSFLTVLLVAGVIAIAALLWVFRILRSRDRFAAFIFNRKSTARISSMAELIDGGNHIPVALTLEQKQIFYESDAIQARLEISRLDEVEYDSEQGTGKKLLRLRAHGQSFAFVLDGAIAVEWAALLPSFRMGEARTLTA